MTLSQSGVPANAEVDVVAVSESTSKQVRRSTSHDCNGNVTGNLEHHLCARVLFPLNTTQVVKLALNVLTKPGSTAGSKRLVKANIPSDSSLLDMLLAFSADHPNDLYDHACVHLVPLVFFLVEVYGFCGIRACISTSLCLINSLHRQLLSRFVRLFLSISLLHLQRRGLHPWRIVVVRAANFPRRCSR